MKVLLTSIFVAFVSFAAPASTFAAGSDLSLQIRTSITHANAGDKITFFADIRNFGPEISSGTDILEVPLPFGVNPATVSSADWDETIPGWRPTVRAMGPGALQTFTFSMTAPAVKTVTLTGKITALNDPVPTNNSASASVSVSGNYADVAIMITGPEEVDAVIPQTFGVTVRNNGPNNSQPNQWTLTVSGASFVAPVFSQITGRPSNCQVAFNFVSCTLPLMLTNDAVTYRFGLIPTVPVDSTFTIHADLVPDVLDSGPTNNNAVFSPRVTQTIPVLLTSSFVAPPAAPALGTMTIVVTLHDESLTAVNPRFTFTPQGGSTVGTVTQSDGPPFNCTLSHGAATCSGISLDVGHSASFALTVHVGATTGTFHAALDVTSDATSASVPIDLPIAPTRSRPTRH